MAQYLIGNMLEADGDTIVITTNGFTKRDGSCVMGKGIAYQMANLFPELPAILGKAIRRYGNRTFKFDLPNANMQIITVPVKPINVIYDGTNIVEHAKPKFTLGNRVPGFYAKADLNIIRNSLVQLVEIVDKYNLEEIVCPRFGAGAGELDWCDVKPIIDELLDDRFKIYTFK